MRATLLVLTFASAVLALSGCGNNAGSPAAQSSSPRPSTSGAAMNPQANTTATSATQTTTPSTSKATEATAMPITTTAQTPKTQEPPAPKTELATFGAGCFWGVEHIFKDVAGVKDAVSGYSGGRVKNPTYRQICEEDTGHAEVVQLTFDPSVVSYEALVDIFFRLHDPTQVNRQGPDIGDQYRSVIFYHDEAQKQTAEKVKAARAPKYKKPIATSIEAAQTFYKAEDYHQDYYVKTGKEPYCHFLRPE
jgi:methionine-S-sulfoxide reductase